MTSETNKKHWKRLLWVFGLFFSVAIIAEWLISQIGISSAYAGFITIVITAIALIRAGILFRCPYCNLSLTYRNSMYSNGLWAPKNCPHCDKELP